MLFSPSLLLPLLIAPAAATLDDERGELMGQVVEVLQNRYYDKDFRREELPELAGPYLERARSAANHREECLLVHEFLSHIPVSHLGLISERAYSGMFAELGGSAQWTFGFQLVHLEQGWFVDWVFEGGPAERAGIVRGDQVLALDGADPLESARLDWRTDDAALPDPAIHALLAEEGAAISLRIRRDETSVGEVRLPAELYSSWEGTRYSVRIVDAGPWKVGYVHYWYIPMTGGTKFLRELCEQRFADCDALVFDLRGRGGAAHEAFGIVKALDPEEGVWRKPLIALVHADSRSAKEVIAFELQRRQAAILVGEKTHGAVIPASFAKVGSGMVLMYPSFTLGEYTASIEGKGVTPDITVAYPLPWTAGADPVLETGLLAAQAWCDEISAGTAR